MSRKNNETYLHRNHEFALTGKANQATDRHAKMLHNNSNDNDK
jgi:hypothetical protein